MTKRPKITDDQQALARDMEQIGQDFAAAFSEINRAFQRVTADPTEQHKPAPKPGWARKTEPRRGWFDRITLRFKRRGVSQ